MLSLFVVAFISVAIGWSYLEDACLKLKPLEFSCTIDLMTSFTQ